MSVQCVVLEVYRVSPWGGISNSEVREKIPYLATHTGCRG
jgi:hypothetical protein